MGIIWADVSDYSRSFMDFDALKAFAPGIPVLLSRQPAGESNAEPGLL